MKPDSERLAYTTHDVYQRTGIPERTVRLLCKRSEIQARKVGKRWIISHDALMVYLSGGSGISYRLGDAKQSAMALPTRARS